jgi:hypothetical protein
VATKPTKADSVGFEGHVQAHFRKVRAPDIQAMVKQARERLLAESDAWLESINFAVRHETDGRLACKLSEAFGAIPPSPEKNGRPAKQNEWEPADPWKRAAARALGQIAIERGSSRPSDSDELEKLVRKSEP